MTERPMPLSVMHESLRRMLKKSGGPGHLRFLGQHVLGDFYDCSQLPDEPEPIEERMLHAAKIIGATVVDSVFHTFSPWGVSGVLVLAESHLAVHTWPEFNFASVDLFTCSNEIDPRPGFDYLRDAFGAQGYDVVQIPRGTAAAAAVPPAVELSN